MIPLRRFSYILVFFCLAACFLLADMRCAGADEPPSAFEAYILQKTPQVRQFGYELFLEPPSTFAPANNVPVGPDYQLGPGDELKVSIWGKVTADYSLIIDSNGKIGIPQMGMLYLSGLTFAQAKTALEKELSRYYKTSEVRMNLSMGALRTVRVFIVGKAKRPGSYTLSSLSTLVNALFSSGGPSRVGSMRDIQVKRGSNTVVHFDMYDFLLRGDKSKDIRLMPEDVIFIPPVGSLAGIAGSVKSPAIYELKGEATVKELIDMAGGLSDIAFKGRVQIDRIVAGRRQIVLESNIDEIRPEALMVMPGDFVRIFSVVPDRRVVRLAGAVERPEEYGIGDGMKVKELLSMAGGLKYYAYTPDAEITRVTPTQDGPKTVKLHIDLKKALEGDSVHNIPLQADDYLLVRSVPEWDLYRTVQVSGQVRFPGTYTIVKGETVSSLIERSGGLTDKAYIKGAVFTRESVRRLQQEKLDEAIDRLEREILSQSAQAIEGATSSEDAKQREGAVSQRKALIAKMRAAKARGRISIKMGAPEKFRGTPSDVALEDGDMLFIPEAPVHVQVIGSVYNQTAFVFGKDSSVSDYLKSSGGVTKNADEGEIYVLKADGTAISKREGAGWGGLMSERLDPGDTIVVPEKIEKIAWLKEAKDITQILYQIAVTAGVLIVAF